MRQLNKRAIIQDILNEYGYSDWHIVERYLQGPTGGDARWILFNFKARKKTQLLIPNHWFEDPRRYTAIRELITLAIQYSAPLLSECAAHNFFFFVPERLNETIGDEKNSAIPDCR